MTLCEVCIQEYKPTGFFPWAFGPCQRCGSGATECFDIPAAWLPDESIWEAGALGELDKSPTGPV